MRVISILIFSCVGICYVWPLISHILRKTGEAKYSLLIIISMIIGIHIINRIEYRPGLQKADEKSIERKNIGKIQQKEFIELIFSFNNKYESATNDLKKSKVRLKRADALKELFKGNLEFNYWKGIVSELQTNKDGDATVAISLNDRITLGNNLNNIKIPLGTKLYNDASELKVGDKVIFSGKFIKQEDTEIVISKSFPKLKDIGLDVDKNYYLSNINYSERDAMVNPYFNVKINFLKIDS